MLAALSATFLQGCCQVEADNEHTISMLVSTCTTEECEAEKARLQKRLNTFSRKALAGVPCISIKERRSSRATGAAAAAGAEATRLTCHYSLDRSLTRLHFARGLPSSNGTGNGGFKTDISLATLQDIFTVAADGAKCFPPAVLAELSPEEQERLLMVVYAAEGTEEPLRFYVVEDSAESVNLFLECMRILCIYAEIQ